MRALLENTLIVYASLFEATHGNECKNGGAGVKFAPLFSIQKSYPPDLSALLCQCNEYFHPL